MLDALITPVAFIFTLGLLVTIHEYGHFQVARWCGVKVLKFSIGFGRPLFTKKFGKDQTEFVLAAIPLGGYVKMLDEREIESDANAQKLLISYSESDLKRAFNRQSVSKRIAIVLAGPSANLLLAIALYWLLMMMGVVGMRPMLGKVLDNTPAATASLVQGETIQKINGKVVATWQDARWILLNEALKNKSVEVQAINSNQEIHIHQLDLSGVSYDDANQDILTTLGLTIYQPAIPARIGEVTKNSPAELSGLKTNDLVLSVNGAPVSIWEDFVSEVRINPSKPVNVLVERNGVNVTIKLTPEAIVENKKTVGRIGAAFKIEQAELDKIFITTHYSVLGAFLKATEKTWDTAIFSLKMMGNMLTGKVSWKGMSGPVTIASYAGQSANMGFKVFISFLALISISIGVLNLLPIPVLDGGHLMYYMVEIFTGKPVSEAAMIVGQKVGFTLLGLMMVVAFYNDINRLIIG